MNGRLFNGLDSLRQVRLNTNVCIDEDFSQGYTTMNTYRMSQTVDKKCGFDENSEISAETSKDELTEVRKTAATLWSLGELFGKGEKGERRS